MAEPSEAVAEPSEAAVRERCLRLRRLSETGRLSRPMRLGPVERGRLGRDVSSLYWSVSGIKNPIFVADIAEGVEDFA